MTTPLDAQEKALPSATRAWLAIGVLFFFYALSMMDRGVISLMVAPIKRDLTVSDVQIGLLQGFAFALLYSLAALPIGTAVDYLNRRKLLFAGVLVWSAATACGGFAHGYTQLFIARAFVGIGEAVLIPVALSLIADLFPRHKIATATAVFTAGSTIGAGASFAVGGTLLRILSERGESASGLLSHLAPWRATFVIFGSIGSVVALLAFLLPDPRAAGRSRENAASRSSVSMNEFGRFVSKRWVVLSHAFLAFPLITCAIFAAHAWAPHYLAQTFAWNAQKIGLIMGFIVVVGQTLGIIGGGVLMDRAQRAGVVAPYFTVPIWTTLIGGPLLALAFVQTNPILCIACLSVGVIVSCSFSSAHYAVLQLIAPAGFRGRLTAVYLFVLSLIGSGLGPLLPPLASRLLGVGEDGMGHGAALVIAVLTPTVVWILAMGRHPLQTAMHNSADEHRALASRTNLGMPSAVATTGRDGK
jgi:MFS family permease